MISCSLACSIGNLDIPSYFILIIVILINMTIKIYSFHLTIFKIILNLLWCVFLFFIRLFLLDFYLVTHFVRLVRGDIFGLDIVLNSLNEVFIELIFIFFLILTSKKLWLILFLINLIDFLRRHNIINCLNRLMIAT